MAATNPGTTNLVSWWRFEEASGLAMDSHGTNHLTRTGVIDNAAALQGMGAQFPNVTGRYMSLTANDSINFGHEDYTIGCWYKPLGLPGGDYDKPFINRALVNKTELFLGLDTSQKPRFSTMGGSVIWATACTTNNWYFVIGWHVASENKSYLQVNNDTPVSVTDTVGGGTAHYNARFGRRIVEDVAGSGINGILDEMFMYRRALNDNERSWLYNDGAGRTYTDTVLTTESAYQINWW